MTPERLTEAYARLFPSRLRKAHLATPAMVAQFARLYRVPRDRLGGLVGMLCRRHLGTTRDTWVDAIRDPERATPHLILQHDRPVQVALGWCLFSRDLWMPRPVMH
jgi:hypothetical protein